MNLTKRRFLLFIGILTCLGSNSFGNDEETTEVPEFIQMASSKRIEKIAHANSVVSVVTAEEIASFGANNLVDVLNRVANVYVMSTYAFPNNMVSIRGDSEDQYNNRVGFALDGRSLKESAFLGDNRVFTTMFPIAAVERIEVIRGPASIYYGGSSALLGVINIVTKTGAVDNATAKATYGSFNRVQVNAAGSKKLGDLSFDAGMTFSDQKGWNFQMTDEKVLNRSTPMSENGIGAVAKATYSDFKFQGFYGSNKQGTIGNATQWGPNKVPANVTYDSIKNLDYKSYSERFVFDLNYSKEVSEIFKTSTSLNYQGYNFYFLYEGDSDKSRTANANDYSVINSNTIKIAKPLDFTFGAVAWRRSAKGFEPAFNPSQAAVDIYSTGGSPNSNPFQFIPNTWENYYSEFGNIEYRITDNLYVDAGGRFTQAPGLNTDFVPEVTAVYSFTKEWSIKGLYGQSFRSPSISERFRASSSAIGNANLLPEKAITWEGQITYNPSHILVSAGIFHTDTQNLISRVNKVYQNVGNGASDGVEIEGKVYAGQWSLIGNTSFTRNQQGGNYYAFGVPTLMAKFGGTYDFGIGIDVGVFDQYIGSSPNQSTSALNPAAGAYSLLSANANFDLNRLFQVGPKKLILSVFADNLLDQSINFVEYINNGTPGTTVNTIPGRPGRSVYGSLSYSL